MEPIHRKVLDIAMSELTDNLKPTDVLTYLISKEILTDSDVQTIQSNVTERDKVYELIKTLKRSGPDAYKYFIEALNQHKFNHHLVDFLSQCEKEQNANISRRADDAEKDEMESADSESNSSDSTDSTEDQENFDNFLDRVGLKDKFKQRLQLSDILRIKDHDLSTLEMGFTDAFWKRLNALDYRASLASVICNNKFSMRDFIYAILQCSETVLRQDFIEKMSACQMAVPIIIPGINKEVQFIIYALRRIIKKWKQTERFSLEEGIVTFPMFTVTVLRIGEVRLSKSDLLNTVLGRCQGNSLHPFFLTKDVDCFNPFFSKGSLECIWYLPSLTDDMERLKQVTAFLNLRGDCTQFPQQREFACKSANLTIVIIGKQNKRKHKVTIDAIRNCSQDARFVWVKENDVGVNRTHIKMDKNNNDIHVQLVKLDVIGTALCEMIDECQSKCPQSKYQSMESYVIHCKAANIDIDEENIVCKEAKLAVNKVLYQDGKVNLGSFKKQCFPLQPIWMELVDIDKESLKPDSDKETSVEILREEILERKQMKRQDQLNMGLSKVMKRFSDIVTRRYEEKNFIGYFFSFLRWELSKVFEEERREHAKRLSGINDSLHEFTSLIHKSPSRFKQVQHTMTYNKTKQRYADKIRHLKYQYQKECEAYRQKSFGCENFLRELGQLYEASIELSIVAEDVSDSIKLYAKMAANLLKNGFAFEMMEGDSGRIPMTWVTWVFDELTALLEDPTVLVLSVIGVQSSGKSTLLNTMFGVRFPVCAGRCTRGLHIYALEVDAEYSKKLGFQYLFIIDSEGIRSHDRTSKDQLHFDNQLVTFALCISDITILNIQGENIGPEMTGLLQIAAHALIRMKTVNLKSQCRIIQQRVSDVTAVDKNKENMNQILETLDKAIEVAAKEEGFESEYHIFGDMFDLHLDETTQFVPCLWTKPMSPPNDCYSNTVIKLKENIFNDIRTKTVMPQFTLSTFTERIRDVWDAVKEEKFIFNFEDSVKAIDFNTFCLEYNRWVAQMRSDMIKLRYEWQRRMQQAANNILPKVYKDIKKEASLFHKKEKEDILSSIDKYIERNPRCSLHKKVFTNNLEVHLLETTNYISSVIQNDYEVSKINSSTEYKSLIMALREMVKKEASHLRELNVETADFNLNNTFVSVWEKCIKQFTQVIPKFEEKTEMAIKAYCEELLLRVTNELAVSSDIHKLLKQEGGIEKHQDEIKWDLYLPSVKRPNNAIKDIVNQVIIDSISDIKKRTEGKPFDMNIFQYILQNALDGLSQVESSSVYESQKYKEVNTPKPTYFLVAKAMLHICGRAYAIVLANNSKYEEKNSLNRRFEEIKIDMHKDFLAFYEKHQDTRAFQFVCFLLTEAMKDHTINILKSKVREKFLRTDSFIDTFLLSIEILKDICQRNDGLQYIDYITNQVEYIKKWTLQACIKLCINGDKKSWVEVLAENEVEVILQAVIQAVQTTKELTVGGNNENDNWMRNWEEHMSREIQKRTGVTFLRLSELKEYVVDDKVDFCDKIANFLKHKIKNDVLKSLEIPKANEIHEAELFLFNILDGPHLDLHMLLRRCQKQCPLCGSPCDQLNTPNHIHSATMHYPLGLSGHKYKRRLIIDDCTLVVYSSNHRYKISGDDTNRTYKNFRRDFPDWILRGSLHGLQITYWKWVIATHTKTFSKYFHCKDALFPKSWHRISQKDALDNLQFNLDSKYTERRQRVVVAPQLHINTAISIQVKQNITN